MHVQKGLLKHILRERDVPRLPPEVSVQALRNRVVHVGECGVISGCVPLHCGVCGTLFPAVTHTLTSTRRPRENPRRDRTFKNYSADSPTHGPPCSKHHRPRRAMRRPPSHAPRAVVAASGSTCPTRRCGTYATGHQRSTSTHEHEPIAAPIAAPVRRGWVGSVPRRTKTAATSGHAAVRHASLRHLNPIRVGHSTVIPSNWELVVIFHVNETTGVRTAIARSTEPVRPSIERPRRSAMIQSV